LIAAIPIVIALLLQLPSQPPSPTPIPHTQHKESKATGEHSKTPNDQNRTDYLPSAIDKLTAEIASRNKAQTSYKDNNNTSSYGWVKWSTIASAAATLLIAVLAFFQWRAMDRQRRAMDRQAEHMRDGLAETKRAADAAEQAAHTAQKALYISSSADILIQEVSHSSGHQAQPSSDITVTLKNCGQTKAVGLIIYIRIAVIEHHKTRPGDIDNLKRGGLGTPRVMGPSEETAFNLGPIGWAITDTVDWQKIRNQIQWLWIQVVISYKDVFDRSHELIGSGLFRGDMQGKFIIEIEKSTP
jgi:hypothetical protein